MNFFEQQKRAKRNSTILIVLFLAAVFCITIIVSYILCILFLVLEHNFFSFDPVLIFKALPLKTVALSFALTIAAIFCASFFKIVSLSSNGGIKIAKMLYAREVPKTSIRNSENMLLNIVEEISIASGIAAPKVFLLQDNSINAFVAGNSYEDAIICVTRGAMNKLNRDELQGVIAHEFSHMFNGDMKLNMNSIGILYGILFVGLLGEFILKGTSLSGGRVRPNGKGSGAAILLFFGVALYIIGSIGVFFGNAIKAAINRQREYLADASAVQFTRNPDGIANALKKIDYYGSKIDAPDASEFSHLYINDGIKNIFSFPTHPPIRDRIKRIDRNWNGDFEQFFKKLEAKKEVKEKSQEKIVKIITAATILNKLDNIGELSDKQIQNAKKELGNIPKKVFRSIDDPLEAGLTIFCMLFDENKTIRDLQIDIIKKDYENSLNINNIEQNIFHVEKIVQNYKREDFLNIILICINTLKLITKNQYILFKETINALILADKHISWFEWNIKYLVIHPLDIHFGFEKVPNEIHKNINSIKFEVELFLSALIYAQTKNDKQAKMIFDDIKTRKRIKNLKYIEYENITNRLLDTSLKTISKATAFLRRDIFEMALFCINKNNTSISPIESESVHAISILLRLPLNIKNL